MTEQEQSIPIAEDESSPRHKHLRKLAEEKEALKKKKEKEAPLIKTEIEVVYDSRGKAKYRKVSYMPNGSKHSEYMSPHSVEVQRLKEKKKR